MTSELASRLRRMLVTDERAGSLEELVRRSEAALAGGMSAMELRAKRWPDRDFLEAAVELQRLCRQYQALFLINDRVDIALACRADGVHLGVHDLPVAMARRLLGPTAIIGYSPETDRDRKTAERQGANYLGIGPIFGTATKQDAGPALGLRQFADRVAASKLPVVGVGGINLANAADVIQAGAVGVATVSAVFLANDPEAAARDLTRTIP
jgi:thiamine-phosphate diphosphorylase